MAIQRMAKFNGANEGRDRAFPPAVADKADVFGLRCACQHLPYIQVPNAQCERQVCWRCAGLPAWTSGSVPDDRHPRSFWGRHVVGAVTDYRHHGECEHDERDVAVPAMPRPGFVVVEAELVLGGLEAVFDCPAMTFDSNKGLDACAGRAPCREKGEIAIADVAADQQATGP